MTAPRTTQLSLARQIKVCGDVIEHLAELDSRQLTDLIEDVQTLRASLVDRLASMDGDGRVPSA